MANLLDRFTKQISGSKDKLFDFIAKISPSGDFAKIKDLQVILASWNNILINPEGTGPFDNKYGSKLFEYIFDPADDITANNIKMEIESKLMQYDDRATVTDIEVNFLKGNKKGFNVIVNVEYKGLKGNLSALIDDSVYFNFMRQ